MKPIFITINNHSGSWLLYRRADNDGRTKQTRWRLERNGVDIGSSKSREDAIFTVNNWNAEREAGIMTEELCKSAAMVAGTLVILAWYALMSV